jgi:hypothetical protein
MGRLNFLGCVSIAGNQRLSLLWHNVAAGTGHGTIQELSIQCIYGQNIEEFGTDNTAMYFIYIFVFKQETSMN